jgi:hypothetical protein
MRMGGIQLPIDRPFAPLALDDEELREVQAAATLVRPRDRGGYLHDLAIQLKRHGADGLGPGLVRRLARSVAERHMNGAVSAAAKQAAEARWSEGLPKREPRAKRQRAAGA